MSEGDAVGHRTVSFLFSDLEGSTRLLRALGDRYPELLERHWSLVRAAAAGHGGPEFGAEGDAMFFAFDDPASAVAAAIAIQRSHREAEWPDDLPVRVRIAVHHGDAIAALGTWLGVAVHQAARTCAAGHGGQVLVSAETAAALAGRDLVDGASLRDLGEYELRDIPGAQRLFQVEHPDLFDDFPALRTRSAARTNLPHQRTTFVGRLREREEVARLLEAGRVVSIVGPGGAGKTRLALEVAGHVGPHFADGAWLVGLAELSRGDDVDALVATTLQSRGVVPPPAAPQPAEHLRSWLVEALRDRRLVLVLDNCEHVIDGVAGLVDAITSVDTGIAVLATSREPLEVPGEKVWRIPALDVTSSAQLFVERSAGATGRAAPDAGAVTALCERLDGLPLAVELAASRTTSMSVAELDHSLDRRLQVLADGPRTADPRQRSLHALIDWSYDLLSDGERATLRNLGVIPASFSLDVAHTVAADVDVFAVMDALVRKSIVSAEVTEPGPSRYHLLEAVRAFAVEKLEEAGERDAVARRLASGLHELLTEAIPKLSGPDQGEWLHRLDADMPSFRAALEWALEADPPMALEMAGRLGQVFGMRGAIPEGRSWVERALAVAPDGPSPALVQALAAAGTLSRLQGDLDASRAHHERQLDAARALGSEVMEAGSLSALGNVLLLQDDLDAAGDAFETSYQVRVRLGDELGIMRSLNNLGVLAGMVGEHDRSAAYYVELLDRARSRGDSRIIGQTLHNLADVYASDGRLDEAAAFLDEAMTHLGGIGDRRSIGITAGLRAAVSRRQGDVAGALRRSIEALEQLAGVGDPVAVSLVIDGVAAALADGDDDARAAAAELVEATARLPFGAAERGLTEQGVGEDVRRRLAAPHGGAAGEGGDVVDLDALIERARAAALRACGTG